MNINVKNRRERLRMARSKGCHTKNEWRNMVDFFEGICVKCFGGSGLYNVERDHIIPIYQGGSDSIDNIQPMCARCNASKGPENFDYRAAAAARIGKLIPESFKI